MPTANDIYAANTARPLALRMRVDLECKRQRYLQRPYWVVKDPIGLKYFRFRDEEFAILQMLDGSASMDDIKRQFESQFAPQKITWSDLQQFIGTLHRGGLVLSEQAGQGKQLYRRRGEVRRREWLQKLTSVLAVRFRGIDPDRMLTRLYPYVRCCFSHTAVYCTLLLALAALTLITVQYTTFQNRLPGFHEFFGPGNWLFLGLVLGGTKILHELGHGFACKHFRGECHEIGFMLLVFTPCLYCNVSDSWLLPNKWHRMAIGAAGIYVELVLAAIATFVWWFTQPGLINHAAISVMFVCSVSTILFNGNPLLRYDGYYILADYLEIPNLQAKSRQILQRLAARWCLGMELPQSPFLPQRNQSLFALYTVASFCYRWVVIISIMWFLNLVLKPYGLQVLGQLVIAFALFGMVVMPLVQLVKFLSVPGRLDQVKRRHVMATGAAVAVVLLGFFLIPLPTYVTCPLQIQSRDAQLVFVETAGQLEHLNVAAGDTVAHGDPILQLKNLDLELEMERLQGELDLYRGEAAALRRLRYQRSEMGRKLGQVLTQIDAAEEKLRRLRLRSQQLQLTAPIAGTVLPPPSVRRGGNSDTGQQWTESPLDPKNLGAHLEPGTLVCQIGDPTQWEATLVIDQGDVEMVRPGQPVRIKLDPLVGQTFRGEVADVGRVEMKTTPASLSHQAGGALATRTDDAGNLRPLSASYQASVPLDVAEGVLVSGFRGRAKVFIGWESLAGRSGRYLSKLLNFHL